MAVRQIAATVVGVMYVNITTRLETWSRSTPSKIAGHACVVRLCRSA